jgi:hypothetical protein
MPAISGRCNKTLELMDMQLYCGKEIKQPRKMDSRQPFHLIVFNIFFKV